MPETIKIDLVCKFCGVKCGEFEPPKKHKSNTPLSAYGIKDTRCDNCTKTHGSFQSEEK